MKILSLKMWFTAFSFVFFLLSPLYGAGSPGKRSDRCIKALQGLQEARIVWQKNTAALPRLTTYIAAEDSLVVFQNTIKRIKISSGKVLWEIPVPDSIGAYAPRLHYRDGIVYAVANAKLVSVDLMEGKILRIENLPLDILQLNIPEDISKKLNSETTRNIQAISEMLVTPDYLVLLGKEGVKFRPVRTNVPVWQTLTSSVVMGAFAEGEDVEFGHSENLLFFGSSKLENRPPMIEAYDLSNRKSLWKTSFAGFDTVDGFAFDLETERVFSHLGSSDGVLEEEAIVALNQATGETLWTLRMNSLAEGQDVDPAGLLFHSKMLVTEFALVVSLGNRVFALDKNTGVILWSRELSQLDEDVLGIQGHIVLSAVGIIITDLNHIYVLDPATGEMLQQGELTYSREGYRGRLEVATTPLKGMLIFAGIEEQWERGNILWKTAKFFILGVKLTTPEEP